MQKKSIFFIIILSCNMVYAFDFTQITTFNFPEENDTLTILTGNLTNHNQLNNLTWSSAGHIMDSDIDMGGNNIFDVDMINATGEIFASSFIVTNESSIFFGDNSINFTTKMFAQQLQIANITRNTLATDATFFIADTSIAGTAAISVLNRNGTQNSNSLLGASNHLGHGIAIVKFTDNTSNTNISEDTIIANNFGNLRISNQNRNSSNLTLGFNDGSIRSSDPTSIIGIANQTDVIVINNKFAIIPFLTNFFYPVIFRDDLELNANLNQTTGNATINNVIGEIGINDSSLIVNLITNGVFENITGLRGNSLSNGFEKIDNDTLGVLFDGVYSIFHTESYMDSVAKNYEVTVGINGVPNGKCKSHDALTVGTSLISASGTCLIRLYKGDEINLMMRTESSPVTDPEIHHISLIAKREYK